jgi:hypothetical protein
MPDDRVCPACQVVLSSGVSMCPKCGRTVAPPETGITFIDIPGQIYERLKEHFGPVGAAIVAGVAFLLLLGLSIGLTVLMLLLVR